MRVIPMLNGSILLDAEPEARSGIEERIGRHAGLAGCELEAVDVPVAALRGPATDAVLAAAGIPVPPLQEAAFIERDGFLVVRVVWGVPGRRSVRRAAGDRCSARDRSTNSTPRASRPAGHASVRM